jgi:protein subunit release factor B
MKQLIYSVTKDDFVIQTFRAGGKGGQNQNKRDTGVRLIHKESGIRAESREHRDQLQNKRAAFRKIAENPEFKMWLKIKSGFKEIKEEKITRRYTYKHPNISLEARKLDRE